MTFVVVDFGGPGFCKVSSRAGETQISENQQNREDENSRLVETKRLLWRGTNRRPVLSRRRDANF